jgi:cyclic beta-1,2-glucan synthetase
MADVQVQDSIAFNPETLAETARTLAGSHRISTRKRRGKPIKPLLEEARNALYEAYDSLSLAMQADEDVSPAVEWIIDNYYIIDEEITRVEDDLPKDYYRKLPKLKSGTHQGLPRVFDMVTTFAHQTDNAIDEESVEVFVQGYQEVTELTIGELWAIPLMIRLVLINRLKEKATLILNARANRKKAEQWVDELRKEVEADPQEGLSRMAELQHSALAKQQDFMIALANQLRYGGPNLMPERQWLERYFEHNGTSLEDALRAEAHRQTELQVSVQNAVVSLRKTQETDWSDFVERCSVVERTLRLDPAMLYSSMDFETRNRYRRRIEELSERSAKTEFVIAEEILIMAEEGSKENRKQEPLANHVGYFLIGDGREELESSIGYRKSFSEGLGRALENHQSIYVLLVTGMVGVMLGVAGWYLAELGASWSMTMAGLIIGAIPASNIAVALLNQWLTVLLPPRVLPKMSFQEGVSEEAQTLVVVPTLLNSPEDARRQVGQLEVRALTGFNSIFRFALLSDLPDADEEVLPGDQATINAAKQAIRQLNRKYAKGDRDRFFLLHRHRKWNKSQHKWMGWERKRGKLEQLNSWLLKETDECPFEVTEGEVDQLFKGAAIRYIITLDADTRMAPGSARDLIRTAEHPLNHPRFDSKWERVVKGYGILQPKVSIAPDRAFDSLFSRIFSGNVGMDQYTTAVSDVYQDSFGEGVFTGKGLYRLDAFHQALGDRFKPNRILSHDLIESNYARCALVTDIEFYDDYPVSYKSYAKRLHRWIRGDWQIWFWILPWVPSTSGWKRNGTNLISRWKVFDNLRRSLEPTALIVFLFSAWTWLPGRPLVWTFMGLVILILPIYSHLFDAVIHRPRHLLFKYYSRTVLRGLKMSTEQSLVTLTVLMHLAVYNLDAVMRTCWRLLFSKRRLLEWKTAQFTEIGEDQSLISFVGFMTASWLGALGGGALIWWAGTAIQLAIAFPFLAFWFFAPNVMWWLSHPKPLEAPELTPDEHQELQVYLRRSWLYFERFVNDDHSWLPPDNIQDDPEQEPAKRTSPTNMGLALVSTISASDMGYLTRMELIARLAKSLGSMCVLEKYRGHFFNWYNIVIGEILNPRYISTVDSGNLAGSLMVLEVTLKELKSETWPNPKFVDGLWDTVRMLDENIVYLEEQEMSELARELKVRLDRFRRELPAKTPGHISELWQLLKRLLPHAQELRNFNLGVIRSQLGDRWVDYYEFSFDRLLHQIDQQAKELHEVYPSLATDLPLPVALDQAQSLDAVCKTIKKIKKGETETVPGVDIAHAEEVFSQWFDTVGQLIRWCREMVEEMEFDFLYIPSKELFSIGYNLDKAELDGSTYDLMASEARLASFIAIAKGDVPVKHWFHLSRRLTQVDHGNVLLSWSGTMFEYLMPMLFMRIYPGTLLYKTCHLAVHHQENYGRTLKKPWGISESAYYLMNMELDYQYRAFGVPGLGLKRGLAEEYVVAPYATMLALMIDSHKALNNLDILKEHGGYGPLGFYEAIDFTNSRLPDDQEFGLAKAYMAHHQGMSIVAMSNVLMNNIMQERFHRHASVRANELLLQEQIPADIPIIEMHTERLVHQASEQHTVKKVVDHLTLEDLDRTVPIVHLLSNGNLSTVLTLGGGGSVSCDGIALNRWVPDALGSRGGVLFYVRDLEEGSYWSIGQDPVATRPDRYEAWLHAGKFELAHVEHWTEGFMEVCVSPLDNMELRRITLTNYADRPRRFDLTSYAEVVLQDAASDLAHPAFSKLFVQTDYLPESQSLLAHRRKRSEEDPDVWMVHTIALPSKDYSVGYPEYESNRASFIGRGRSLQNPLAMESQEPLSRQVGSVLDPIVSHRVPIELGPGEKRQFTFGLGFGRSREEVVSLADQYSNPHMVDRVFELAKAYGLMELEHLDLSGKDGLYYERLASSLLFNHKPIRAPEEILSKNRKTQSSLWAYGISGDFPLVVVRIHKQDQLGMVEQMTKAHRYWRQHGMETALVFMNEHPSSYADEIQKGILSRIEHTTDLHLLNKRGGLFVVRAPEIPIEDRHLMLSVAHVVIDGELPPFDDLIGFLPETNGSQSIFNGQQAGSDHMKREESYEAVDRDFAEHCQQRADKLLLYNEYGGFDEDGTSYHVHLPFDHSAKQLRFPPAPWVNVLANDHFGTIVSEQGSSYTWSKNSRENRLTPWFNDPVEDPTGETILIADREDGEVWSPYPSDQHGQNTYWVEHRFGSSHFTHSYRGIQTEMVVAVDPDAPVKLQELRITNPGDETRKLTVMSIQDLVMGVFRHQSARHIGTEISGARLYAENHYNNEFAGRTAFAACVAPDASISCSTDRLACRSSLSQHDLPKALFDDRPLDERAGYGEEPCFTHKLLLELAPGAITTLRWITGEVDGREEAEVLIERFSHPDAFDSSLDQTEVFWRETLNVLQVKSPDPGINMMVNGWLLYQNLSSRIWARSGFYQSGGAFGFRDQLQDSLAFLYIDAQRTREQILLHGWHQFPEGDVLHWWHPPTNRGIRSRITDDLLWLPYAVYQYLNATDDFSILDEEVPFLQARLLEEHEEEAYLTPEVASQMATIYEHCCRTLDRSLTKGPHGLPLIGTGDWNDGMNKVGPEGKGESVWLGFFLYDILTQFIPICEMREDSERQAKYAAYLKDLHEQLQESGWDGQWYRRAYYDDGEPMGSALNEECKIDAIAQSWSVLSGAAPKHRAEQAMDALKEHLIDEHIGIIKLLTPPFAMTHQNPGYIKGYVPGVRENGGQYTHAAIWAVRALAQMGRGNEAGKYLRMLMPYSSALTREQADRYKVEPYAVAADIYSVEPYQGRGGWTWYTGSAGWLYRLAVESIFGFSVEDGQRIILNPCIPADWSSISLTYQVPNRDGVTYRITVENPDGVECGIVSVSGTDQQPSVSDGQAVIPISEEPGRFEIEITLGQVKTAKVSE